MSRRATAQRNVVWGASFGFWALIILLQASQIAVPRLMQDRPVEPLKIVAWMTAWLIWALLTPVVASLTDRFSIDRRHLLRTLSVHLGLGSVVALVHVGAEALLRVTIWSSVLEPGPPWASFVGLVVYRFHYNLVIYWAIVGVFTAIRNHIMYNEKAIVASQLESQLRLAQLQALKAQLHPHFIFNTQNAILSLMVKNQTESAQKMLVLLGDCLRVSLDRHDAQVVSLRRELEGLEPYIEIQRIRFADWLAIDTRIDPGSLGAEVPSMMLQPLVENAIEHGVVPESKKGVVTIESTVDGNRLILRVWDNGKGVEDLDEIRVGVGLGNTRARLQRLYGSDHDIDLSVRPDGGMEVRIAIPFRSAESDDDLETSSL